MHILQALSLDQENVTLCFTKTNSEMLIIDVLGVAVTCVHELVVFLPKSRRLRGSDIGLCAVAS